MTWMPCAEIGCGLDAEIVDSWVWEQHVEYGGFRLHTYYATECPKRHRLFGIEA